MATGCQKDRQRDRQTARQKDRQTDRKTERQTERLFSLVRPRRSRRAKIFSQF